MLEAGAGRRAVAGHQRMMRARSAQGLRARQAHARRRAAGSHPSCVQIERREARPRRSISAMRSPTRRCELTLQRVDRARPCFSKSPLTRGWSARRNGVNSCAKAWDTAGFGAGANMILRRSPRAWPTSTIGSRSRSRLRIVVIGVFLGIQASNWNQQRIERRAGARISLRRLVDELDDERPQVHRRRQPITGGSRAYGRQALAASTERPARADRDFLIDAYQVSQIDKTWALRRASTTR